ncbi:MAG: DUF1735 domain-containing protein [Bacteroidales bacterium]|nr:DUF1735 domain-containing protein [Bacteroidales bacterium]
MKRMSIIIAGMLLVSGCFPDERNNFMVPDSFGITSLENVVEASVHTGSYVLGIAKSGKGQTAAHVEINRNQDDIDARLSDFNAKHDTEYKAVMTSLVEMDAVDFDFTAEEAAKEVTISWDPDLLARFMGDSDQYVIPVLIKSEDPVVQVKDDRSLLLVHLKRSSVSLKQKSVTRTIEKKTVERDKNGNQPPLKELVSLDVEIDNPIAGVGITYPLEIGETNAPSGLVRLVSPSVTIPEGGKSGTVQVELDYSVLLENGILNQFPDYDVPVRIKTDGMTASLNGESFPLQGLSYGNTVTHFTFFWKETKKGLNFSRAWGLYSTEGESWSDYMTGFTAGADRNVTLDGDFVYVAETNQSKNLWAISLKDPGNFRKLPVGTVKDEGIFYLSCPRVIPNTNADINGGKDLLVVSNMIEGDPTLYVYLNGINSDPVPFAMTTWASRRLGDTFSWWGSYQDGVVFFKDYNTTQGTVTFWLSGKASGTLFLMGRLAAPAQTGAAAYFPFPDDINSGIISVRGGETSWLVTASKNLKTLEGADNNATLTELDPAWGNSSFRYFTLAGKRYVAIARQDSSAAGRLIVLEGEGETNWGRIVTDGKVVYEAAIQNDTENEALDESPSARFSGNSGMDLDVYKNGEDVYIAVVKQNVGLSLFRVSNDE